MTTNFDILCKIKFVDISGNLKQNSVTTLYSKRFVTENKIVITAIPCLPVRLRKEFQSGQNWIQMEKKSWCIYSSVSKTAVTEVLRYEYHPSNKE
jgi:hypothetical protein